MSVFDSCEQEFGNVPNRELGINWNARREPSFVVRDVVMSNAFWIDSMTRCASAQWKVSRVTFLSGWAISETRLYML